MPATLLKENRRKGKWCIHSHACHLAVAQPVLAGRFDRFLREDRPEFKPYFPDKEATENDLLDLDLREQMGLFRDRRSELVRKMEGVDGSFWRKTGLNPFT